MSNPSGAGGFKKGRSGNPKGRPKKGKALTDVLRRVLAEPVTDGKTKAEELADTLWKMAKAGDLDAVKYIYDRLDGKPTETQEVSGPGGKPLELQVVERIVTRRSTGD